LEYAHAVWDPYIIGFTKERPRESSIQSHQNSNYNKTPLSTNRESRDWTFQRCDTRGHYWSLQNFN